MDTASLKHRRTNLYQIQRIVITFKSYLRVQYVGILPRLRERSIVPINWTVVVSQFPIFDILFNRVRFSLGRYLQLRFGILGNFDNYVEMISISQGNVVPRGNILSVICKRDTIILGATLSDSGAGHSKALGGKPEQRQTW